MQKCIFYILWYVKSATLIHCNSLPLFRTNISIDTCVDTSWLLIQWSHSEWRGWGFGHGFSWNFAANRQEKRPTHPFTQNPKMENVCQPLAKELNSASCGQVWGKTCNEPMSQWAWRFWEDKGPLIRSFLLDGFGHFLLGLFLNSHGASKGGFSKTTPTKRQEKLGFCRDACAHPASVQGTRKVLILKW